MREIKFRAWIKNKMVSWDEILEYYLSPTFFTANIFEKMQFTGLKDKNGVEIYEGDIVDIEKAGFNKAVCVYNKKYARFDFRFKSRKKSHVPIHLYNKLMVIGNIHENPDLLDV